MVLRLFWEEIKFTGLKLQVQTIGFLTAQQIENVVQLNKNKNHLLFLNSPNNPSGTICKNLNDLANVAKKYNLLILSDEIYSEVTFSDGCDSISNYNPEGTIISTGLSKWCGAGGWRLGFFAIPESLRQYKKFFKNTS